MNRQVVSFCLIYFSSFGRRINFLNYYPHGRASPSFHGQYIGAFSSSICPSLIAFVISNFQSQAYSPCMFFWGVLNSIFTMLRLESSDQRFTWALCKHAQFPKRMWTWWHCADLQGSHNMHANCKPLSRNQPLKYTLAYFPNYYQSFFFFSLFFEQKNYNFLQLLVKVPQTPREYTNTCSHRFCLIIK